MNQKREFYPEIEPYHTLHLEVGETNDPNIPHKIFVAEYGNKEGIPVIVNHGGPGSGTSSNDGSASFYARYFDPKLYHIVLIDQRGAGQSTPHCCLDNNTTQHLIEDIEKVRRHLNLGKCLQWGGSWGSTLSLSYALKYPEHTLGLILRGVFLARDKDISAFMAEDCDSAKANPQAWADFKQAIGLDVDKKYTSKELFAAAYKLASNPAPKIWQPVAIALSLWEKSNSSTDPDANAKAQAWAESNMGLSMGRIELHYMFHQCFIEEPIIDRLSKLSGMPVHIVQGESDSICPPNQAKKLETLLEEEGVQVNLVMTDAGHSGTEKENISALINAGDAFAKDYKLTKGSAQTDLWAAKHSQTNTVVEESSTMSMELT